MLLAFRCPRCNEVNPPGARFCAQCGVDILKTSNSPETPSREASGGSSASCCVIWSILPAVHPARSRRAFRNHPRLPGPRRGRHRSVCGYIARYVGDGILSYFGWPEGKEADAERAVRAALAVVGAFTEGPIGNEKLQVRVGVATGTVVVGEPIGSGASAEQTAIGITPNLAARLEEVAGPDGVAIDAATRRLDSESVQLRGPRRADAQGVQHACAGVACPGGTSCRRSIHPRCTRRSLWRWSIARMSLPCSSAAGGAGEGWSGAGCAADG